MNTPPSISKIVLLAMCAKSARHLRSGATQREWIRSAGIQWSDLSRWLKARRERARWIVDPDFAGHRLTVVEFGDDFLGTSKQTPPHRSAVSLTLKDITLYALNVSTLAEHYGERLGIASDAPSSHAHGLWKIGVWARPTEAAKSVFFFLPESVLGGRYQLQRAVSGIHDCVLLCCTAETLQGDLLDVARERNVHVLVLSSIGLEPLPLDNLRVDAPASSKSGSKKAKQLLDVPHGCSWKEVKITIHPSALTIRVRKEDRRISPRELGLRGRDKRTPSALFSDLCSVAANQHWEPDGVKGRTSDKRLERLKELLRRWLVIRGEPFVKHGRQIIPNFGISLEDNPRRSTASTVENEEESANDQHVDYTELSGFSVTKDTRFLD